MASSSSELRQRRGEATIKTLPDSEDVRPKPATSETSKVLGWGIPFTVLIAVRTISARSNIIHDCDEVFNYWEPLHYLLYKSGFQTWEYSSEFALRSYLYIVLHALIAAPASRWFGMGQGKVVVFYLVRLILGFASTISDTALVVAVSSKYGRRLAITTLFLLAFSSGCFIASTSFLPSTFSMYAITLSSAALLLDRPAISVSVAAIGVLLGWPFSILTAGPLVIYALATGSFKRVFLAGATTSICVMLLSILTDYYYYGRWTSSVLNLLVYNVVGGGESHLYGVEGPLFYLRNGFNNFNFALPLALLSLPVIMITKKRDYKPLVVVVSPVYLWLIFMSLQPHKEERFLYPIYPLICLAAAAVIERFPDLVHRFQAVQEESLAFMVAKILRPIVLGFILAVFHSRTNALLYGYSAPIEVYKHLASLSNMGNESVLCVGSEWHRFPSSFFLPSHVSEVRWILKMINHAHLRGGKIISFVSYCGGLPSPAAANNPLGYKFSWSPAGALKAGRNPAVYNYKGQIISVNGESLYDSATSLRLTHLPAFALERLPNRDSLVYGDLYGITDEAFTVFRATLRYEGFSEIMNSLSRLGFFNNEFHPMLSQDKGEIASKPTFNMFLQELLKCALQDRQTQKDLKEPQDCSTKQMDIVEMLIRVGCCKESASANKTASCIKFLGLDDDSEIPDTCKSAFDVICSRMEERLNYSPTEQDMVLLHHEVEVVYGDGRPSERHAATLLEFGKTENEKPQSAMARTVGIPAAIGAMLLLEGKIKSTGVLRPLEPEIYLPALEILAASGIHMNEEVEYI